MANETTTPADGVRVRDFLAAVFDGVVGYVNVRTLAPVENAFFPLTDIDALETFVKARRDQRNAYIGVAARVNDHDGALSGCGELPALFADVDFKTLDETEARATLAQALLPPSAVVHSGGGLQLWWFLKEPIDLRQGAAGAKTILRRLTRTMGGDMAAAEPARILRLPNTWNFKYEPKRPVRVETFEPSRRYNLSEFEEWLPEEPREVRVLAGPTPDAIPAGSRNAHLTSLAGTMRRRGMTADGILAALLKENEQRCRPSLSDAEVQSIVASVGRYAPASNSSTSGTAAQPAELPPVVTRIVRQTDEDCYSIGFLELGIEFQANYLRRERYETFGELVVVCDLAGARTVEGNILSRGSFNFSSTEARYKRGKQLADMSRAPEVDWPRFLEGVCVTVLEKMGDGEPAVLLRDLPRPSPDAALDVDGLKLLKEHPVILFGDGGAAKSYLALYAAGRLAARGLRVGLLDWELAGEDHRERLGRLFWAAMPAVWYRRCRHPLIVELDSLRRWVRRESLDYLVYDSVAFAAHDKPEAAESALRYFNAVRQIGAGSLHVAHINRSESGEDKPFGSAYWHNSARATYFLKRSAESADGRDVTIGVFNKKSNLGPLLPPFGLRFTFDTERTGVTRTNLADVGDLAQKLPIWQRMTHLLQTGPRDIEEVADELGVGKNSIAQAIKRGQKRFTKVPGADGITRIALVERWSA